MAKKRDRRKVGPHGLPGAVSLFRYKVRAPVSITLTPGHHAKVRAAMARLSLSRADVIGLLIDRYADTVTTDGVNPPVIPA